MEQERRSPMEGEKNDEHIGKKEVGLEECVQSSSKE